MVVTVGISPYLRDLREIVGTRLLVMPAVAVLIWDQRGRLLMVREAETGLWQTVGGSIEPDESPQQAAVREAQEETGVVVELQRLRAVAGGERFRLLYPNGDLVSYVSIVFDARILSGEPVADQEETSAVAWFWPAELDAGQLTEFTVELLDAVGVPRVPEG
jgi:8-oxo-dGTP pyrophosphatase MutT (NUDIX family)